MPRAVPPGPTSSAHRAVEAIWRIEAARVIGAAARILHDVGLGEECAQDALVAALEHWAAAGVPDNPGAWLTAAAKRRALDRLRHERTVAAKAAEIGAELDFRHVVASDEDAERREQALDDANAGGVDDDILRLMFTACHPVLAPEARCALTLRLMGGLTTAEIARAYLKPESAIAQRIVRAKRSLAAARVPYAIPRGTELAARLDSVLEVIYLIFNEGYAATAGGDWMRPALSEEALRLGRVLAGLMPDESEVRGLVALMEIQASRFAARRGPDGEPILLVDQDRGRWDRLLIRRGLDALARAEALAGGRHALGPYAVQASIAACHARAARVEDTDWARIVALYDVLARLNPSPVIVLNQAVAVGMAFGPAAALEMVDGLRETPELAGYHLLPAVRGDLLHKLGRAAEAGAEFARAAELARNDRERAMLLARAALHKAATPDQESQAWRNGGRAANQGAATRRP